VNSTIDHISVCICTYKRPDLLCHLLKKLQHQETSNLFTYSAVVVDNDANKTAEATVADLQKTSVIRIDYFDEPVQNIALARNKAVDNASGNYIAFIDDDEFPEPTWLLNLYKSITSYKSDGVLGPVRPHYPDSCPDWLIKSKLCERSEHQTGTAMHWGDTRTGNVLLDQKIFKDSHNRFGQEFGRTGGEDIEFFKKMMEAGKVFVWCNEAPAYETVPPERWTKDFYIQRDLRIGGLVGENIRKRKSKFQCAYSLMKSIVWITMMGISLPLSRLIGEHIYMRAIDKIMYNVGVIFGFMGRTIIRDRVDQ
jgi:succinoglycan biosynthesis protein ExoM